jgi:solute carrier family 36 (proton-coupled amino acid transporter)
VTEIVTVVLVFLESNTSFNHSLELLSAYQKYTHIKHLMNDTAIGEKTSLFNNNIGDVSDDQESLLTTTEVVGNPNPQQNKNKSNEMFHAINSFLTFDGNTRAMMHSVGALGQNERVDPCGTIHLMTFSRAHDDAFLQLDKKKTVALKDLFQTTESIQQYEQEEEEGKTNTLSTEMIDTVEGGSLMAAVFGIIKGTVGPAILYLPRGFKLAGYAIAIPALLIAMMSYLYTSTRLLQCWKSEKDKAIRLQHLQSMLLLQNTPYQSTATGETRDTSTSAHEHEHHIPKQYTSSTALLTYPELARRAFGPYAFLVSSGIAILQFGVCLTYLIFVPQNLFTFFHSIVHMLPETLAHLVENTTETHYLILMIMIQIPLSWIVDIRKLTPYNVLATLLIAFGLLSCVWISLCAAGSSIISNITSLPPIQHDTWGLFVGTSFYVFEGSITLLLPLQEAVYTSSDKKKFPNVNRKVVIGIVVFYIVFAMICWGGLGDGVSTALTTSLPSGWISSTVQMAYSIAVIFTFPLQGFPALAVSLSSVSSHENNWFKRNLCASLIILGLGWLGHVSSSYLGNVASLLGGLVGIPIALIFPPIIHNILIKDRNSNMTRWMNNIVSFMGCIAMVMSTYITLHSWKYGAEKE